jgi:hypothetical protein
MNKMAIMLATDDLKKLEIYEKFISENKIANWRIKKKYTKIQHFPINLFFFHKSIIKYCALCENIIPAKIGFLSYVPQEYHNDKKPYKTFILISKLKKFHEGIHIKNFPKYDNPTKHFERGQQGILRVEDTF